MQDSRGGEEYKYREKHFCRQGHMHPRHQPPILLCDSCSSIAPRYFLCIFLYFGESYPLGELEWGAPGSDGGTAQASWIWLQRGARPVDKGGGRKAPETSRFPVETGRVYADSGSGRHGGRDFPRRGSSEPRENGEREERNGVFLYRMLQVLFYVSKYTHGSQRK